MALHSGRSGGGGELEIAETMAVCQPHLWALAFLVEGACTILPLCRGKLCLLILVRKNRTFVIWHA